MTWRVAASLLTLRDQINASYPGRSKGSDGTIGDPAHQAQGSASDHNPWFTLPGDPTGIVTALDITHDPAHGLDIDALSDQLAQSRDRRIKYIIANDLILSGAGGPSPWVWRAYGGSDPHTNHLHLSVVASSLCDAAGPWAITGGSTAMLSDAEATEQLLNVRKLVYGQVALSQQVQALSAKTGTPPPVQVQAPTAAEIAAEIIRQLSK